MDIVPELAKPGEPQGLVGDEAGAVIDHEDESAGQQQQADKPEETADHASPYICRARKAVSQYRGSPEIQPHQHLMRHFAASFRLSKEAGKR